MDRARGGEHAADGAGVQAPGRHLRAQLVDRGGGAQARAVRPVLAHGLVGVGRGEHAGGQARGERRAAPVVARAVEALVVRARERGEVVRQRRAGEDALGEVGVQPHPFPVVGRERSRPFPHAGADAAAAQVVHETRAAQAARAVVTEAELLCGARRQGGHAAGVAQSGGHLEVREVRHHLEQAVEPRRGHAHGLGFEREQSLPEVAALVLEERARVGEQGVDDLGIIGSAAPPADHRAGGLDPTAPRPQLGVPRHHPDADRQRHRPVGQPGRVPGAVEPLETVPERRAHPR